MQVGLAFGTLLERILVDFMAKLGGKLEPSWPILAVLSCLILPYLTLSYLTLSCLILPWLSWVSWPQDPAESQHLGPTGLLREYQQR